MSREYDFSSVRFSTRFMKTFVFRIESAAGLDLECARSHKDCDGWPTGTPGGLALPVYPPKAGRQATVSEKQTQAGSS